MSTGTRILRLKLVNFIGIYAGMGLTTFEVDFTKTDKRTIILLGANGSGKSTVQSCLTPFSDTFDNRSKVILDGKDGLKEIDIQQDDYVYHIKHYIGENKSKSFITKIHPNGTKEELNPAGTIRNFPSIIEEELGLTENYIKLNKIGSKCLNFIDLSSTKRKDFIGDFTPDTGPFLAAYANVTTKYSATTKEIRFITDEFSKLQASTTVEKNIQVLKTTIKTLKNKIAKLSADREKYKSDLSDGEEILIEIDDQTTKLSNIESNIEFERNGIETQNARYKGKLVPEDSTVESIKAEIEKREVNCVSYKESLDAYQIQHAELSQSISSTKDEVRRIQKDLNNLTTSSGIKEVAELTDFIKTSTESLADNITYLAGVFEGLTSDNFEDVYEEHSVTDCIASVSAAINTISNITSYVSLNAPNNFDEVLAAVMEEDDTASPEKILKTLNELKKLSEEKVDDAKEKVKDLTQEHQNKLNEIEVACKAKELLGSCSLGNDECCLYREVSENTNTDKNKLLEPIKNKITKAKEVLKECEVDRDIYVECYNYLDKLLKVIRDDRNTSEETADLILSEEADMHEEEDCKYNSLAALAIHCPISNLEALELAFKTSLKEYNFFEKTNNKFSVIRKAKNKLVSYSSSESTVRLLETNISEARKRLIPLESELETVVVKLEEARKKYDAVSKAITAYRNVLDHLVNIDQYTLQANTLTKSIRQLTKQSKDALNARDKLKTLETDIVVLEEELETHDESLSSERLALARIEEFVQRKEQLEIQRAKLAIIKDSLDVKTGIPLVLVGDYLNDIRDETNRLLHIAFKGKFYIDFEISDKSFDIPVYKAGRKSAKDVLECSQGEVSLVKTSLSLGIIAQAISTITKQYNIVSLDEIDSELDHHNRLVFLDILNKQLDTLHSAQCFVITHNDCFFNSSAALMLFPGAKVDTDNEEFMLNKDILFKA